MKALFSVSPVVLFTVFLMLALPVSAEEKNEAGFKVWLQSLKQEALEKGYTAELVDKALDTATFRPTVVKADKNQPEKKITNMAEWVIFDPDFFSEILSFISKPITVK